MIENVNQHSNKVEKSGFRILGIIIVSYVFIILTLLIVLRIKGEFDNRLAKQSVEKLVEGLRKGNIDSMFQVKMTNGLPTSGYNFSEKTSSNYTIDLLDVDFGGYYVFNVSFATGKQLKITMERNSDKWDVIIKE
jgi:hypothetical protein